MSLTSYVSRKRFQRLLPLHRQQRRYIDKNVITLTETSSRHKHLQEMSFVDKNGITSTETSTKTS
jgi:hypothetical protein